MVYAAWGASSRQSGESGPHLPAGSRWERGNAPLSVLLSAPSRRAGSVAAGRRGRAGEAELGSSENAMRTTCFQSLAWAPSDQLGQRRRRGIFMAGDERCRSWAVSFRRGGWVGGRSTRGGDRRSCFQGLPGAEIRRPAANWRGPPGPPVYGWPGALSGRDSSRIARRPRRNAAGS